jgi:hypothetical protein
LYTVLMLKSASKGEVMAGLPGPKQEMCHQIKDIKQDAVRGVKSRGTNEESGDEMMKFDDDRTDVRNHVSRAKRRRFDVSALGVAGLAGLLASGCSNAKR